MGAARITCVVLACGAVMCLPAAHADVIAGVDVPVGTASTGCPQHTDIALIDAATGARTALPAGVNTSADELHPSITPLGNRMTFQRIDPSGGTTQIVAVDLGTGQQAPLFNLFDAQSLQPEGPILTPDGNTVITGASLAQGANSQVTAGETVTPLTNFPAGPFLHSTRSNGASFPGPGRTLDPVERSDGLLAVTVAAGSGTGSVNGILLDKGAGSSTLGSDPEGMSHPALSDPTTNVVVFQHEAVTSFGTVAQLAFRPVGTFGTASSAALPAVINAKDSDELNPAFTTDGRYLGFVRYAHGGDRHMRLFVFDTQTQTLLNSAGIDLGSLQTFGCETNGPPWPFRGGVTLRETIQLLRSSLSLTGTNAIVSFQLASTSGVGILVQRIVGHHRLLGHRVPTLKSVGRVPFGQFSKGRHKVHWTLRVSGHRLSRGTYLVTPRLVSRSLVVHELGKPRTLHIR